MQGIESVHLVFLRQGIYSVSLDQVTTKGDSFGNPFRFHQNIFNQTGLSAGKEHLITLQGPPKSTAPYVDLDYIIVTQGDGNAT